MLINYLEESEKFRPERIGLEIKTLLIGEAPPPSEKKYFYLPRPLSNKKTILMDRSLPVTIFYHYFQIRPYTIEEYAKLLLRLQKMGIFLIDICDNPIEVRNNPAGIQRIISDIPKLRNKLIARNIKIEENNMIFLLPRPDYLPEIKSEFPNSRYIKWKDFRMSDKLI